MKMFMLPVLNICTSLRSRSSCLLFKFIGQALAHLLRPWLNTFFIALFDNKAC